MFHKHKWRIVQCETMLQYSDVSDVTIVTVRCDKCFRVKQVHLKGKVVLEQGIEVIL